jgi:hypothetical protein
MKTKDFPSGIYDVRIELPPPECGNSFLLNSGLTRFHQVSTNKGQEPDFKYTAHYLEFFNSYFSMLLFLI